jgi:hypothetical protein
METEIKILSSEEAEKQNIFLSTLLERNKTADDWIDAHASGTLRKNKKLNFSWKKQYLEERIAWEFGWWFKCLPRTRLTFGDAITEGDCKPITEAGWHIERFLSKHPHIYDYFEVKYIMVSSTNESSGEEGIGLILRATTANWVPGGHLVYCIVTQFNTSTNEYQEARSL